MMIKGVAVCMSTDTESHNVAHCGVGAKVIVSAIGLSRSFADDDYLCTYNAVHFYICRGMHT
jgi:hypothetical protein